MLPETLLLQLADGQPHARAALAAGLGLDAAGLAAGLAALEAAGLEILESTDGALRLSAPIDWVAVDAIEAALDPAQAARVECIERVFELESTNRSLLAGAPPAAGRLRVAVAEYQHGGRGRRGRRWRMPPGAGLALSAGWRFARAPAGLTALSLAVGAAARRAIRDVTGVEVGLKWPNDLIVGGGKLGGILVELDTLADGGCHVVAGIGLNVRMPAACLARLGNDRHGARDLASVAGRLDRSVLAGALVSRLAELFAGFAETGFASYRAEWLAAHVLDGEAVELSSADGVELGTVRGIGDDGALIVENEAGGRRRIVSGEVTVRAGV